MSSIKKVLKKYSILRIGNLKHVLLNRLPFFREVDKEILSEQEATFVSLGLDRNKALFKINEICMKEFNQTYSEMNGMWSEHLVLFAALSDSQFKIASILEIGTFKAETTLILSRIFPSASIISIDLTNEELSRSRVYEYIFSDITKAVGDRNELINRNRSIEFKEINSLNLISWQEKFDLIWIDGDHLAPVSTLDIYNSLRLLSDRGIALCDDVYINRNHTDRYSDTSSFETLKVLETAGLITVKLLRKRLARVSNLKGKTKYLGFFQKK